jgi:hypothetical protein
MREIVQAIAQQYAKRGSVLGGAEFREYVGLLRDSNHG